MSFSHVLILSLIVSLFLFQEFSNFQFVFLCHMLHRFDSDVSISKHFLISKLSFIFLLYIYIYIFLISNLCFTVLQRIYPFSISNNFGICSCLYFSRFFNFRHSFIFLYIYSYVVLFSSF